MNAILLLAALVGQSAFAENHHEIVDHGLRGKTSLRRDLPLKRETTAIKGTESAVTEASNYNRVLTNNGNSGNSGNSGSSTSTSSSSSSNSSSNSSSSSNRSSKSSSSSNSNSNSNNGISTTITNSSTGSNNTSSNLLSSTESFAGSSTTAFSAQTFYVPLPEEDLLNKAMNVIASDAASPILSLISVTVSTDYTIIWYDHWEDGYEINALYPVQSTTEVWGDGNATNGCVPTRPCTNANDILRAGDSVVLQSSVPIPRNPSIRLYDGGDCIQASYPIAITRGAYTSQTGAFLSGGVEVRDTTSWGRVFIAPVGQDLKSDTDAFEYTAIYIMAANNDTIVTLPDSSTIILQQGKNAVCRVNQGDTITASNNIQANIITGDIGSQYEMRWFSLLPVNAWASEYATPVGDTIGSTRVELYNPTDKAIRVDYGDSVVSGNNAGKKLYMLPPRRSVTTDVIPNGTGALFTGDDNFFALSITDTVDRTTWGQAYEWGFTLMPTSLLSSQVLVGLGWGCKSSNCSGQPTSGVFVTPMQDADLYIDFNNDGVIDRNMSVIRLRSVIITDPTDRDMSGALIFATQSGTGAGGPAVKIAAAWGEVPAYTTASSSSSMDMGTLVLPFESLQVKQFTTLVTDINKDGKVSAGDTIRYTIQLMNVGQRDIAAGTLKIVHAELDPMTMYIAQSTWYSSDVAGKEAVSDDRSGTSFPVDGTGIANRGTLKRRGGALSVSFDVILANYDSITSAAIVNSGFLTQGGNLPSISFQAITDIDLNATIQITKSVYLGSYGVASCNTKIKAIEGLRGTTITYCYEVKNTGSAYLNVSAVSDTVLGTVGNPIGILAPGRSQLISADARIETDGLVSASITATVLNGNLRTVNGYIQVKAEDSVNTIVSLAPIQLNKTVYVGDRGILGCGTGDHLVEAQYLSNVTYCYTIANSGSQLLENIALSDPNNFAYPVPIPNLASGTTHTMTYVAVARGSTTTTATVAARLVQPNQEQQSIIVSASDSAGIEITFNASMNFAKTVYLGNKGVEPCTSAVGQVQASYGSHVTYCYTVTNTGTTLLDSVVITDFNQSFTRNLFWELRPGDSETTAYHQVITDNTTLSSVATARAKPLLANGRQVPGLSNITLHRNASMKGGPTAW